VLKDPSEEPAMLLDMINFCSGYTGIVTYNGKGFDVPLLRTRLVINRLPNPFETLAHFDLLYLARRIWKNRLPSRSLQDLEHEILDIPRTDAEVPGWMIPEIYFTYLRNGDATQLKGVIYHNGMDILSLAALFLYLSDSFENINESTQFNPIDYYSLGQLYYGLGLNDIAIKIFNECDRQGQLPTYLQLALFQRLGEIHKSQQNYEMALVFWQKAAIFEDIDSSIELAKYYEHLARDYEAALFWTETAIAFLTKRGYHTYQSRSLAKELLKRKDRLSQKKERKHGNVSEKIG
jgi:tetratricopeptide (TPR) repeat protein